MTEKQPIPEDEILTLLAERLQGQPLTALGDFMSRAILDKDLAAGTRLPTVRAIARQLGVSPASVSVIWTQLRERGLIQTNRRGGSFVASDRTSEFPNLDVWSTMDLAYGVPDSALQPSLAPAFAAVLEQRPRSRRNTSRKGLSAPLRDAVERDWPFPAEAFVAVGGHNEGTMLAVEAAAPRNSLVVIEEPTSPRILSILGILGLRSLPVRCDGEGPLPAALSAALAQHPAAVILQPRAQIPTGRSIPADRLRELAEVLARAEHPVVVVEDDHMGPVATSPDLSVGAFYSGEILHVRGYCKSYGVDLRTCVIGGSQRLIDRVQALRVHGISATSEILQNALAWLIRDPATGRVIETARRRYEARRLSLAQELARRGLEATGQDGMLLCLKVRDEASAVLSLAQNGLVVGFGSKCFSGHGAQSGFVRLATSLLPDSRAQIVQLADIMASALEREGVPEPD
ncbi:aminotransferase class I/II-fold pyridoxal phosphate-dependent enzyme [Celeribacter indicus]|uniref:GntR family transcriptional regulator n=1 Tax=Celeribacter indicus TaxID=1208324 RepID=A0A0B5E8J0_9RHOB|nr:aminotransferase class I/II-fold pyridoxal phosphate-dependent enzyme [Celeribacter indicus]AJE48632.1 GntR family transcriptional regulator [Celeribacter indicus]SDX51221.1 transcriptional regulator, GntR family [Celeribacter indicus]